MRAPGATVSGTALHPDIPLLPYTPGIACAGDGTSGARVQILYMYDQAKGSRLNQLRGEISLIAAAADSNLARSAELAGGYRRLRWVHTKPGYGVCRLDIKEVPAGAPFMNDWYAMLNVMKWYGYNASNRKYVVFVEGPGCGLASFNDDERGVMSNSSNITTGWSRLGFDCWGPGTLMHELGHNMGAVGYTSPHSLHESHCLQEYDVMCYTMTESYYSCPDQSVGEWLFDCNFDDYFDPTPAPRSYLATHWNTANHRIMLKSAAEGSVPALAGLIPDVITPTVTANNPLIAPVVSWTNPPWYDHAGTFAYRMVAGTWQQYAYIPATGNTLTLADQPGGTTWTIQLRTVDGRGFLATGRTVTVTRPALPASPPLDKASGVLEYGSANDGWQWATVKFSPLAAGATDLQVENPGGSPSRIPVAAGATSARILVRPGVRQASISVAYSHYGTRVMSPASVVPLLNLSDLTFAYRREVVDGGLLQRTLVGGTLAGYNRIAGVRAGELVAEPVDSTLKPVAAATVLPVDANGRAAALLDIPATAASIKFTWKVPFAGGTFTYSTTKPLTQTVEPLQQVRVVDTRQGGTTVDGRYQRTGALAADTTMTYLLPAGHRIPNDAAAMLQVTATTTGTPAAVAVFACATGAAGAVDVSVAAQSSSTNLVTVPVGAYNRFCVTTSAPVDLTVDLVGVLPAAYAAAGRLLDTRPNGLTVDGQFQRTGPLTANQVTVIPTTGRARLMPGARTAVVSVTVFNPTAAGTITFARCGLSANSGQVGDVAFQAGPTVTLSTFVPEGPLCVRPSTTVDMAVDARTSTSLNLYASWLGGRTAAAAAVTPASPLVVPVPSYKDDVTWAPAVMLVKVTAGPIAADVTIRSGVAGVKGTAGVVSVPAGTTRIFPVLVSRVAGGATATVSTTAAATVTVDAIASVSPVPPG